MHNQLFSFTKGTEEKNKIWEKKVNLAGPYITHCLTKITCISLPFNTSWWWGIRYEKVLTLTLKSCSFSPCHKKYSQSENRKAVQYVRRYHNKNSHHALCVCRIDWVGNCIFMEWCYATLTRAILWNIAHVTYIFLIYTHSPTEKKKQVTLGILHDILVENVI